MPGNVREVETRTKLVPFQECCSVAPPCNSVYMTCKAYVDVGLRSVQQLFALHIEQQELEQ